MSDQFGRKSRDDEQNRSSDAERLGATPIDPTEEPGVDLSEEPEISGEADQQSETPDTAARVVQRRRTRRNPRIWMAVGALAVVAIIVWQIVGAISGGSPTSQYTTSAAEKGTLAVTVDGSGYLYAAKSASVSPKVSGTVSGLHVAVGRVVEEGDVLFYIENDDLDTAATKALASYRNSKEAVEQAELQLAQAEQQLDEVENPSEAGTRTADPTEQDLEIARERVDAADEGLSAARASRDGSYQDYEQALEEQEARTVTAPMDGVITELNVANGDSVSGGGSSSGGSASSSSGSGSTGGNSGTSSSQAAGSSSGTGSSAPIVITNVHSLYAKIPVNEVDVTSVKRRQKVTMTFDAIPNLTITGKVIRISPSGNNSSGVVTFDVSISFDVQNARLKPGMSTSASIVTAVARDAVLVPNAAIETTGGESYVRVLDNANGIGTPREVPVKTGLANDTMTQIVSGLKVGEYVVTGQRVQQGSSGSSSGSSGFRLPGMGGSPSSGGSRSSSGSSSGGSSSGGAAGGPPHE